ncbi:MAG: carboxypeptidase regulatory-like domain-containing protein [Acidobacteria bacterium]|nr:carboxypeptidase regulatory-like domain-containing protein [Acidobacteriota bacterium]
MNKIRCWSPIALFIATGAQAICPHPTPKVCAKFFESDVVFLGKVTALDSVVDVGGDVNWLRYTTQVKEVYRGQPKKLEQVRTENASARWDAEIGKTYLVFASRGEVGATCGPLDEPEYAQEAIRQIHALRNVWHATIEGQVLRHAANGDPTEGIRVKVMGTGGEYESITDSNGLFSIALPPGRYRIDAKDLQPSEYSRQDLEEINLVKGQCAQFELTTRD